MQEDLFHAGERLVQERTGERAIALINARNVGTRIPAAARTFIGQQHWCVIGAADDAGSVWACAVAGEPGFLRVGDDLAELGMTLDDREGHLRATAPIGGLQVGQSIAVLLIDLQTRRRLRINGHVASASADALAVAVGHAFPVCPRYIQKRQLESDGPPVNPSSIRQASGTQLDDAARDWIAAADTLFIASVDPQDQADVSHRGGRPGFVQLLGQRLRIPDYNGNSMFNTLGNLMVDSRCGIVVPDFVNGRQLQLGGRAQARFDDIANPDRTGGTGRWIEFEVEAWRITAMNRPWRWRFVEASRFNP